MRQDEEQKLHLDKIFHRERGLKALVDLSPVIQSVSQPEHIEGAPTEW